MEHLRRWILLFCIYYFVGNTSGQCDREKASVCITEMEDAISALLENTSGDDHTQRLQRMCLDVIKGNNLTQCFIDATSGCSTDGTTVAPGQGEIIQRWEKVMQDLYGLCDGACPNFLERTVNITQCTSIIRFDALYESSYQTFCSSLNTSLQCVSEVTDLCPHFGQLFYDLLPTGMEDTADTLCTGGCENFDEALDQLEACKKYVTDLPDDFNVACQSYEEFKTCVRMSDLPEECPMFGSLMEVLYPQHIFGIYDKNCNKTLGGDEEDACGDLGKARIDHCVRIFALVWPAGPKDERVTKQQCLNFDTGTRCLEKAHFAECPELREYFSGALQARRKDKIIMEQTCPNLLGGNAQKTMVNLMMTFLAFASTMVLVYDYRS